MMSRMKEKYSYRTIVMIDFVLEIINTPHWGLLINKNKNRDNLIKKAVD